MVSRKKKNAFKVIVFKASLHSSDEKSSTLKNTLRLITAENHTGEALLLLFHFTA